jgi:chromosome segregation ATPase
MDENIKEAFSKAKQDIYSLKNDLDLLNQRIIENKNQTTQISDILKNFNNHLEEISRRQQIIAEIQEKQQEIIENLKNQPKTDIPAHNPQNQTDTTHSSTHNDSFKPLNTQNIGISKGNEGVPADRQTHQQTDRHIENTPKILENPVDSALEILESLDNLKKEIRLKFKRLTDQEWLIFSAIYQLDEQQGYSDYKTLATRLKLTESSIRDYIGRLIKKGIPLEKHKINNKTVQLSVSSNLKKIASLSTIIQLRGL